MVLMVAAALPTSGVHAQSLSWRFAVSGTIAELHTPYTPVIYYLPYHPQRVVVLAPGYPWRDGTASDNVLNEYVRTFPNPHVSWPFGEAPGNGCESSATPSRQNAGTHAAALAPPSSRWLTVATAVPIHVMVGTRDGEQRPSAPGQVGSTRLERAHAWVKAMTALANRVGKPATVQFVSAPNPGDGKRETVEGKLRFVVSGAATCPYKNLNHATPTTS